MAELVDDIVPLISGADHVVDVDGVRDVFLDVFNAFHVRLAIPEGRK